MSIKVGHDRSYYWLYIVIFIKMFGLLLMLVFLFQHLLNSEYQQTDFWFCNSSSQSYAGQFMPLTSRYLLSTSLLGSI